jgi:hypothetical protein
LLISSSSNASMASFRASSSESLSEWVGKDGVLFHLESGQWWG